MKVPLWLESRPINRNISSTIIAFSNDYDICSFGELSRDYLVDYYQKKSKKKFFKLLRTLGFYGVIFYKRLSQYSGPKDKNPQLIHIPEQYRDNKIPSSAVDFEIYSPLKACGIYNYHCLNGVPLENLLKLIKHLSENNIHNYFSHVEIISSDTKIISPDQKNQTQSSKNSCSTENINSSHSIEVLELSVRPQNRLNIADIKTVEELLKTDFKRLYSIKGMGTNSISEIKEKLNKFIENLESKETLIKNMDKIEKTKNDLITKFKTKIGDMNLSVRTHNCLKKENLLTIEDIIQLDEAFLLKIPNFGKRSLNELKEKLALEELQLNTYDDYTPIVSSIGNLKLSPNVENCLANNSIFYVYNLLEKKIIDSIENSEPYRELDSSSIQEIKRKLNIFFRDLTPKQKTTFLRFQTNRQYFKVDLMNEDILSNLQTQIKEIFMSTRCSNCLKNENIKFVWELTQYTREDLLRIKALGKNVIQEIETILSNLSLDFGQTFTKEEIQKIQSFKKQNDPNFIKFWFKQKAKEFLKYDFQYLNEKEKKIIRERSLVEKKQQKTLEELGTFFDVTRERIRQLEKKATNKIKHSIIPVLEEASIVFLDRVNELGGVANFEDLDVDLSNLTDQEKAIVQFLVRLKRKKIYIDWDFYLVSNKGKEFIERILKNIKAQIQMQHENDLFTIPQMTESIELIMEERGLFKNKKFENITKKFVNEFNITKEGKYLSFGRFKKIGKTAIAFKELYPTGLRIYQNKNELLSNIKRYDPQLFKDATKSSIVAHITNHSNILLWNRGFYIHEGNISFDLCLINKIKKWIINYFEQKRSRFQVSIPFYKFEEELISTGVPNQYALYSLIRKYNHPRIGQRKFPTFVDLEANIDLKEGILDEIENYFLDKEKGVSYDTIKREFIKIRGWKEHRVQYSINSESDSIYPWKDNSFIHIDHLKVDYDKLNELINKLRNKLKTINGPYHLKGAKSEMVILWETACPSATTRTITKLIRQENPEDLVIERNFIRFSDFSVETFSIVAFLEEFFLEQNREISRHELKKEFDDKGWTDNQIYGAIRNANIFQLGNSSFVHPATIDWNDKISQETHEILCNYLIDRNSIHQPHVVIQDVLYDYSLPELPNNIEWTRQLLISIGKEYEDLVFFEDSFIFADNQFDIEDIDDIIGYFLAKEFPFGIAPIKELEELLYREGILIANHKIPNDQFFEGSSICFLESNNEVCLSDIGKDRYAKK